MTRITTASIPPRVRRHLLPLVAVLTILTTVTVAWAAPASNYYVGTYVTGTQRGVVTVQFAERLPTGDYIGWTTLDGVSYLGNITINGDQVDVTWYASGGSYQVPLGTIHATLSADGQTMTGRIRQGLRSGLCRLIAA